MQFQRVLLVADLLTSSSDVADKIQNLIPKCSLRVIRTRDAILKI